uniref:AAA domain-containing protein n=1 Tax=Strongyloides papillosus TaxID=174720 RepID=A0A0N5BRE2_STREA
MNFYRRAGPILRQIFKKREFCSCNKTNLDMCPKRGKRRKMLPCIGGTTSDCASTSPHKKLFQSFNKEKKTAKPENTNLYGNKFNDWLSKFSNDKKEAYMKAPNSVTSSKNSNISESKQEKKKYPTINKNISVIYSFIPILQSMLDILLTNFLELQNFLRSWISENNVPFDDVQAMVEIGTYVLKKIFKYLSQPKKYVKPGKKLPKGVLLVGSPRNGETLLASAIACEVNVPFFYKSGSEFNEVSPGQGAEKLRELFRTAKRNAPCIIFIYKIDSIGSNGDLDCFHPFAKQIINQLIMKMDGFDNNDGIIVIGATNRLEDLDEALLRTEHFDTLASFSIPDLSGRIDVSKIYLDKVPHRNIDIDVLAKTTTGFSAADISNVVNQTTLKVATEGCHYVMQKQLEDARDRLIMGPVRIKGKLPNKESNRITAYQKAGQILVALYTPYATPIHRTPIMQTQ